ncbi:GNAT family N-acetyltransferase [Actinoplanes utahensis]|uniref:N-acetyltransferase domain-containing protein n=1 Tax=Actinoplanes utahensis TaxID=1869 RepID=A0A0A6UHY8_ACTUT|nr:GNAT family N-acetyltransferase [Actinoplanes utahensis]KHD75066.1 hypothetical protein MB27_25170 [Actinoplanes utahensis]GIF28471.1 hypothetical protein Aut01nite_14570 [Actinoplanes utahensis]
MIDADRDPLIRWALYARDARVWRQPSAVVVACPDLSHWDRLVMNGEPAAVAGLLREVLVETGETFRPFGTEELVGEVVARVPDLEVSATFAWMETTTPVKRDRMPADPVKHDRMSPGRVQHDRMSTGRGEHDQMSTGRGEHDQMSPGRVERDRMPADPAEDGGGPTGAAGWLGQEDEAEVTALIRRAYPQSYAWPGGPGVRRWAGIRSTGGELLTVAAEAWSTPEIGFMSGVATLPAARGRGLGAAICEFTANELLAGRERVALLVDYWNTAALATYTRLGFTTRRVAAARRR